MAQDNILSLSAMEKLLKKAGAYRVSEEAKEELRSSLESFAQRVGSQAVELSKHAKRTTIKSEDIKLAAQR